MTTTTTITGVGILEDIDTLTSGVRSGNWIEAGLGLAGTSLDALGLAFDPIGTVLSWGVAWLMEHLEPLREALDKLAGSPDRIADQARMWREVSQSLSGAAVTLSDRTVRQLQGWTGIAADSYRDHSGNNSALIDGTGRGALAVASMVEMSGQIVAAARALVRDLIAELIVTLFWRVPRWIATGVATAGVASPLVVAEVTNLVRSVAAKIARLVKGVTASLRRLAELLSKLRGLLRELRTLSRGARPAAAATTTTTTRHWTGVRYLDKPDLADARVYERIRANPDDVPKIAANTGIPQDRLEQIKQHIFFREHELPTGPGRVERANFTPDPEFADLWPKAEMGTLTPAEALRFRRLMAHEYMESTLMQAGLPYRSAHPEAWDEVLGLRGTPKHHGAHDLSPHHAPEVDPFVHWKTLGREHPGVSEISDDLSNLDDVIRRVLKGE